MKGEIKYYLKKPRSEIVKDLLIFLALGTGLVLSGGSPLFVQRLLKKLSEKRKNTYNQQSFRNAFYRLRREGCLTIEKHNHQIYISLTQEGKKRAGRFQINDLSIAKPKRWDRKWRIVIFDVRHKQRIKREALRGFLKRLGFYQLQKSVWVHPYDCSDEVELLQEFFGFTTRELTLILAEHIQDDGGLRRIFYL